MKKYIVVLILLSLVFCLSGKHLRLEKEYQKAFQKANGGVLEYKIKNARIDIVLDEYVVEVDFLDKFYEAVGQSLYYSILMYKDPAILIIIEKGYNVNKLESLLLVCQKYNIKLWTIDEKFVIKQHNIF